MLSDTEYIQVGMAPFNEYVDENIHAVDLLVAKMRRKGIEMTELEAWKYISWCLATVNQNVKRLGGPQAAESLDYMAKEVGRAASAHYVGWRTGTLPPPTGPRFNDPLDHQRRTRQAPEPKPSPKDDHHGGYL